MIVIGADTHKQSHTVGAVDAATGRVIADKTVKAKRRSFDDLLGWARGLDSERVWAIEDCRHVSGALERFLLVRGERVVRVAPKLVAGARTCARERGNPIGSMPWRSRALRCAKAWTRCRLRSFRARSSTCACSSITASD